MRPIEQLRAELQEINKKRETILTKFKGQKLTLEQRIERLELLHDLTTEKENQS